MWTAFKLLPVGTKIGILIGILTLLVAAVGSAYTIGWNKGINVSKVAIAQYEGDTQKLIAALRAERSKEDVRIITVYKDRINYIDRTVTDTRTVVRTVVPEQFNLSRGWIYAYNQSVLGLPVDPVLAADATPSTVSEMRALADTIVPNNGVSLKNREQLLRLQEWVRSMEKSVETVNNP